MVHDRTRGGRRFTDRGRIAPGAVAHLAVLDPAAERVVEVSALAHRNPVSAYAGLHTLGVVTETWLRGRLVATADHGVTAVDGVLLDRPTAPQHARNERSSTVVHGTEAP